VKRVIVTAAQSISAAGIGRKALAEALQTDRLCSSPSCSSLPIQQIATVREKIKVVSDFPDDRKCWLGIAAAELAWEEAQLGVVKSDRLGIFVGTGLSSITPHELEEDVYPHLVGSRFARQLMAKDLASFKAAPRRHMPHRLCSFLSSKYNATGASGTNFSACAAAAQAIAAGMKAIRRGEVDVALVGGHDSMNHPMGLLSFVVLGALSPESCRPFDRNRNGFMLGEGAGFFVLESEEHARSRGVKGIVELCGAGTSIDAWNATAPHPDGLGAERAMMRAIRDSGLSVDAIDYVNAHGTGTPLGDVAEANAINRIFGPNMLVSSIKGAVGHCIAAAGAIEAVACIAGLEHGFLPGTAGFENQDPECKIKVIASAIKSKPQYIISNSFGFGGQNCALIFGRVK
jgi:3-oxoacyl-[acyl-carrier-protein] synthase II